jgi:signal transduction histidine kinase
LNFELNIIRVNPYNSRHPRSIVKISRTLNYLLIYILLNFFCFDSSAQLIESRVRPKIDSLKNLLPRSEVREQVDILNQVTQLFAPANFDSAIRYSAQAMRMATVNGYERGIGISRLYTGNAYYYKMDFKNALISYLSAQNILEEGKDYDELGELYLMLGHINFFIMRSDVAASYYRRALANYKLAGNEFSQGDALHELSITYWRDGPVDSAVVYGHKYLDHARKYNYRFMEASAMVNLGMTYADDSMFYYNEQALQIAKELNDYRIIGIIYFNNADVYIFGPPVYNKPRDLKLARYYLKLASEASGRINYNSLLVMIYDELAYIDILEGWYDQATYNLDKAEACHREYIHSPENQPDPVPFYAFGKIFESFLLLRTKNSIYNLRFELALKTAHFTDAIRYQRLYYESADTLRAVQQGRQLELLMAEADAERNDQKFRSLAQENELSRLRLSQSIFISAGIGAFVMIISLFLLLFVQRKRLTAEQKSILMEQRLLRAQMNPHFLFNSLASIQNYIINEDTDRASIYLSRFSQLVRNILDNSVEEYVPLEKEIETVKNYLELQKVRYAGKFDYNIDIDPDIDTDIVQIPPMLAQPFIENSIEHGIRHRDTPGRIDIRFRLEDSLIRFEVEDDGVGREKAKEIEARFGTKHRSMATSITRDRLMSINKKLKRKIRMEIVDLKDEEGEGIGTRVTFGIPVVVK